MDSNNSFNMIKLTCINNNDNNNNSVIFRAFMSVRIDTLGAAQPVGRHRRGSRNLEGGGGNARRTEASCAERGVWGGCAPLTKENVNLKTQFTQFGEYFCHHFHYNYWLYFFLYSWTENANFQLNSCDLVYSFLSTLSLYGCHEHQGPQGGHLDPISKI